MNSISSESLTETIRQGFGSAVEVSARRPGRIFQVSLPAYLADGDAALIFVEPTATPGVLRVSDLAHTVQRLSYTRDVDDRMIEDLGNIAWRHGFSIEDGTVSATVDAQDLIAALLGLAQIEACAESAIRANTTRGPKPEEFRALVIEALRKEFREAVEVGVQPPGETNENYKLDAVLNLERKFVVATIGADLDAERAVGTRYKTNFVGPNQWLAVPRDLEKISRKSRERLLDAFVVAGSRYDEARTISRIKGLAA